MPAQGGHFGEVIPGFSPGIIEETKLDAIGDAGEQGEVDARSIVAGAKWIWFAAAR